MKGKQKKRKGIRTKWKNKIQKAKSKSK